VYWNHHQDPALLPVVRQVDATSLLIGHSTYTHTTVRGSSGGNKTADLIRELSSQQLLCQPSFTPSWLSIPFALNKATHTFVEMAEPAQQSSRGLAVSRLSLDQLEQVIGLIPAEQQALVWHSGAEAFENDENHPERWGRAVFCYQKAVELSDGKEFKPAFLSHLSLALLERASSGISPERDT
jgi:hypothetical protein